MSDNGEVCMVPGCERKRHSRGLCRACYNLALTLIKKGKATWADLEERGKVRRPIDGRGRTSPAKSWFLGETP